MLTLQVGKRYVQRDGVVTLPLQKHERTGMFYAGVFPDPKKEIGVFWYPTGVYGLHYGCHLDLVEEYVDKSNWLQVGKFYSYMESGRKCKCVAVYGDQALLVVWRSDRIKDWYSSKVEAANVNQYCVEMPEDYQHEPSL